MTPQTIFAIGSCTKAFTAFVLGTLVDDGKLEWDTPLVDLLPDFKLYNEYATNHITPLDLINHRSGLPRHDMVWYNNQEITRKEPVERPTSRRNTNAAVGEGSGRGKGGGKEQAARRAEGEGPPRVLIRTESN